jgi:hypothetical protein
MLSASDYNYDNPEPPKRVNWWRLGATLAMAVSICVALWVIVSAWKIIMLALIIVIPGYVVWKAAEGLTGAIWDRAGHPRQGDD